MKNGQIFLSKATKVLSRLSKIPSGSRCESASARILIANFIQMPSGNVNETETITQLCFTHASALCELPQRISIKNISKRL